MAEADIRPQGFLAVRPLGAPRSKDGHGLTRTDTEAHSVHPWLISRNRSYWLKYRSFIQYFEFERKVNFALSSEKGMTARACIDARIVQ